MRSDPLLLFPASFSGLTFSHLLLPYFAFIQGAGRHLSQLTDPTEHPSTSAGLAFTFTPGQHQEEAGEAEHLEPGVTDLQEENSGTSPALRSTLEHIVQQLDILTQVSIV